MRCDKSYSSRHLWQYLWIEGNLYYFFFLLFTVLENVTDIPQIALIPHRREQTARLYNLFPFPIQSENQNRLMRDAIQRMTIDENLIVT